MFVIFFFLHAFNVHVLFLILDDHHAILHSETTVSMGGNICIFVYIFMILYEGIISIYLPANCFNYKIHFQITSGLIPLTL